MIRKFTCVPISSYEVLVVTNGSVSQVESSLITMNEKLNNEIPVSSKTIYFESFKDLITHIELDKADGMDKFRGKTVFMFFDGVEFVQSVLQDVIDYSSRMRRNLKDSLQLSDAYFYFDASIVVDITKSTPSRIFSDTFQFVSIVSIANDIFKKMDFMLERVRSVFLDDIQINGERNYALRGLQRNFPNLERIELTSNSPLMMGRWLI